MTGINRFQRIALLILAVVLIAVLGWKFLPRPLSRVQKLPDGSIMRLEKVSFGKRDENFRPMTLEDQFKLKLAQWLPKKLTPQYLKTNTPSVRSGWWTSGTAHTNLDALHLWFTRRDATNGFLNVNVNRGELVDADGCVFPSTMSGGDYLSPAMSPRITGSGWPPQSGLNWLTFEAFPRHDAKFRLLLFDNSGNRVADFMVANPAPAPKPANWLLRPVPMTNTHGDLSFALAQLRVKPNSTLPGQLLNLLTRDAAPRNVVYQPSYEIAPKYEVHESGVLSKEWTVEDAELWDSSGNCALKSYRGPSSMYLSPREAAWKLSVKFFGTERAASASNVVVKVPGLKMPGPGEFIELTNVSSWPLGVLGVALGGPGQVVYSNNVPVSAAEVRQFTLTNLNSVSYSSGMYGGQTMTLTSRMPQLALRLAGLLGEDQRLTIRAVDEQGREYYAEDWVYGLNLDPPRTNQVHYLSLNLNRGSMNQFNLNLPPEAKTVDLYFCLHLAQKEEFIFKPPQP